MADEHRSNNRTGSRIQEIADRLEAQGVEVSVSNVRQAMDNRESYSRVHKELEEWRQQRRTRPPSRDAPVLDDVERTMTDVMQLIWRAAAVQSRAEIRELREAVRAQLEESHRNLADSVSEVARLESEVTYQSRKIDELSASLQASESNVTSKEQELASLRDYLHEVRGRERDLIDKVEALSAKAAVAETELRHTRNRNEHSASPLPSVAGEPAKPPAH